MSTAKTEKYKVPSRSAHNEVSYYASITLLWYCLIHTDVMALIPLCSPQVSRYSLSVQAFDSGSPAMSSTVTLNIDISDVNDNPPIFNPPNSTAIIQVTVFVCLLRFCCICSAHLNSSLFVLSAKSSSWHHLAKAVSQRQRLP